VAVGHLLTVQHNPSKFLLLIGVDDTPQFNARPVIHHPVSGNLPQTLHPRKVEEGLSSAVHIVTTTCGSQSFEASFTCFKKDLPIPDPRVAEQSRAELGRSPHLMRVPTTIKEIGIGLFYILLLARSSSLRFFLLRRVTPHSAGLTVVSLDLMSDQNYFSVKQ
jgi:hypothetical protein